MLNYCANGPAGYNLTNSLRFRSSASAYLNRTPASAGNRQIMTYSFWVKRGAITGDYNLTNATTDASNSATLYFNSSNNQTFDVFLRVGATNYSLTTSQVFRDPSAWYHIVVAIDTTQATSSNRTKVYVNGSQVTNFLTANYVPQNSNLALNNNVAQYIGFSNYFDGYMTEINFIDGQALTPSSFGSTNALTGVWQPKQYTGAYGTNGFYLKFSNIALTSGSNTGLGQDYSGNGNYWNTNNISVTAGTTYDAMSDVPTLTSATVANYAVLNPLDKGTTITIQNANLQAIIAATHNGVRGTFQIPTSGKWYWEVTIGTTTSNSVIASFGLATNVSNLNTYAYNTTGTYALYCQGSPALNYVTNGSIGTTFGSPVTGGTVCNIAYDADNGQLYLGVGNTYYSSSGSGTGNPSTSTNPSMAVASSLGLFPYVHVYSETVDINFGQRPFTYTPPTGFNRLNTFNLPTSTIVQGNKYMDATLYTGTRATQVVTNTAGFKPDMVWCRGRSFISQILVSDSVRGVTKQIFTPLTIAEQTDSTMITSFNDNGFTLGDNSGGPYGNINYNIGASYVGWQWQAGQGTTSSNTDGSITSTVSVNTTAGFSIVTYTTVSPFTNATVGHSLGVAPAMIITFLRNAAGDTHLTWHKSLSSTQYLQLQTTSAVTTNSAAYNGTSSTTFTLGSNTAWGSGNYVSYCFAEIAGFSKFGSYTGNGSGDGPFVYLGFRPKYVMIKLSSISGENWYLLDSARNTYNPEDKWLIANGSDAEGTTTFVDFLSNGFKVRSGGNFVNYPSGTLIYAAFAENPFKNALAR